MSANIINKLNNFRHHIEYVRNKYNTFRIIINKVNYPEGDIYTFRMGGDYDNCINISININVDNNTWRSLPLAWAHIINIKYEPECRLNGILQHGGDVVDMIKLALQYINYIFPEITVFELKDNSNIECEPLAAELKPPRKPVKPLSLSALYVLLHGKTWYERHFNAELKPEKYLNYKQNIQVFSNPINKPIEYLNRYVNNMTTIDLLRPYYDNHKSWHEFINKIPRNKRCKLLYNWISTFVNDKTLDSIEGNYWYIDINRMSRINMEIVDKPIYMPQRGGKATKIKITFQNKFVSNF